MTENCHLCHRPNGKGKRELRPYGKGGAPLCAGCMFGEGGAVPDADAQVEAGRQLSTRIDNVVAAGYTPMVGEGFSDGPLPAPASGPVMS